MKLKPKVCMRSISGVKIFFQGLIAVLLCTEFAAAGFAGNPVENIKSAVVEQFQESSTPLFNPEDPIQKEKKTKDPFFDKIHKKSAEFSKKEQERQRKFAQKVRESDWSNEERREKLAEFNQKRIERREKFSKKQQEKIEKYLQERS